MKCIIDVVYNHTSPDAVYVTEHPEFYYRKPDGRFGNKTADWTDVIDLDYSCAALWDAQIQHLCYWAGIVDGFRCDVASLVPVEFWRRAREAVEKVHPGCIWLAESVHRSFLVFNRLRGITAATDNELYEAFDMEYEYDIRETFDKYIAGEQPLSAWMDMLGFQEAIYPENYVKLRYMENHDMPRITGLMPDEKARGISRRCCTFSRARCCSTADRSIPAIMCRVFLIRTCSRAPARISRRFYRSSTPCGGSISPRRTGSPRKRMTRTTLPSACATTGKRKSSVSSL